MKIACVIIDNRKLFYLNNVFKNFFHYLEEDRAEGFNFDFILYTDEYHPKVYLEPEVIANISHIRSRLPNFYLQSVNPHSNYSWFLTHPSFWSEFLSYDRVLIFQHDSILTRHRLFSDNWEFIKTQEFIGAPVGPKAQKSLDHLINNLFGITEYNKTPVQIHNGGLSIRDPKIMFDICSDIKKTLLKLDGFAGEDIFYSYHCQFSMKPNKIFLEYRTPSDEGYSLRETNFYGVHLSLDALFCKDSSFIEDIPYLLDIKNINHLWTEDFYKVNRPKYPISQLLTKIQDQLQLADIYNLC